MEINMASEDQNLIMSPFCKLADSWPFTDEDSSIFLPVEDYIDRGVAQNIFQAEKYSVAEARVDERLLEKKLLEHKQDSCSVAFEVSDSIPSSLHQEGNILPIEEITITTNCELNSFLDKASESLCPISDERRLSSSIKCNDTIDLFDPSVFLVQESSGLEPRIHGELQDHSLNNCNGSNLLNCFEASVNFSQIVEEGSTSLCLDQIHELGEGFDSSMLHGQETSALAGPRTEKGSGLLGERVKSKSRERKQKCSKRLRAEEKVVQLSEEDGSFSKKQEHNAKEKVRRMKLNASFLALGALLPSDSRRKKKGRSAPVIIDRALDYIPELEIEIEKLTHKKNNLLSTIDNEKNLRQNPQSSELGQAPTVSVHEVAKGEVIIQGCIMKDQGTAFSNLLKNVEAEGMRIMSVSTIQVCKGRVCYHLHIQINRSSLQADYVTALREEISSWLC